MNDDANENNVASYRINNNKTRQQQVDFLSIEQKYEECTR